MEESVLLSPRRRALLLAGYAVATLLSFPHPLGGQVLDLGWLFVWLAPALLMLGLEGAGPRLAARLAFAAGMAGHAAVLHWAYVVTVSYGHAPVLIGLLAPLGLALYVAAFSAAFGGIWAWLRDRRVPALLAVPLLWTVLEHARSFVLTGFPWASLGYAQHQNVALLGLASVTGVYGLSFVTALTGAALAETARALRHRRMPGIAVATSLVFVLLLHGFGLRAAEPSPGGPMLRVAALQGNVDQGRKWDAGRLAEAVDGYKQLTRRAAARGARLIVWPETAVPTAVAENPELLSELAELARETHAVLVVGGVGTEGVPGGPGRRFYDSAFVFGPSGRLLERYDKSHLVPFGEYVPLRSWLGRFLRAFARGVASLDVSPGPGPRALLLPAAALGLESDSGVLKIAVPICYELLFPDLMRRFARDGAAALFAITNDAWYGRTGAPYQFLAMTAMRSAESGLWLVRAANSGVSAIIDSAGRVRQATEIFERDLIVADIPLRTESAGNSFYVEHGDVFSWSCWGLLVVLVGFARKRRPGR